MDRWIPITQYAIEEGVSISTLRRKIKSNAVQYRLDNGRYLIRSENDGNTAAKSAAPSNVRTEIFPITSRDTVASKIFESEDAGHVFHGVDHSSDIAQIRREQKAALAEMDLKWRAFEVRLNGLAKKLDFLVEQNSELNMLVKVFEEKLNATM